MSYIGAGTRSSPIAIDDSEDEVVYELSKGSSSKSSPTHETSDSHKRRTTPEIIPFDDLRGQQPLAPHSEKKRKRANSYVSQDMPVAGPSHAQKQQQQNHPSLVNRLSQSQPQPESKKARKRRRKAERQALEEARLKNIDWLNNANQFIPSAQTYFPPHMTWSIEHQAYNNPSFSLLPSMPTPMPSDITFPQNFLSYSNSNPYEEAMFTSRSPSPRLSSSFQPITAIDSSSSSSKWVSAMAMAAESSSGPVEGDFRTQHWSPISTEVSLPPAPPPPLPPPPPIPPNNSLDPKETAAPEFHHVLPPKPTQPASSIGMHPDPDPNSKHGIFHLAPCFKDMGVGAKKKTKKEQFTDQHVPNPARTLVMEQLPKPHRQADFINRWARSACGALPLHLFIDAPSAKALIEFATAELARKAWASPKLGGHYAGLKSHQLKGKPRVDLIKVWWYRVDGVGAGAGVGEIEEGEIEGDFGEKEPEASVPTKETKKERKARLAKEREEKKLAREAELKATRELQMQEGNHQQLPTPDPKTIAASSQDIATPLPQPTKEVHLNPHATPFQPPPTFVNQSTSASVPSYGTFPWVQVPIPSTVNRTAFGASILMRDQGSHDDNESIASSVPSSETHGNPLLAKRKANDSLSDFDETDMEVDEDIVVAPTPIQPLIPAPPVLHKSLPPRPPPQNPTYASRSIGQKSSTRVPLSSSGTVPSSIRQAPTRNLTLPPRLPDPSQPSAIAPRPQSQNGPSYVPPHQSSSTQGKFGVNSVPLTAGDPTSSYVSSESKMIKQAPTEPSFAKRALLARQKELEEKIAKSKSEIAAATANKSTPPQGAPQPLPEKPAMAVEDKQAMEVRLRNLVLQSQRAKAKPVPKIPPTEPPATVSTPVIADPPARHENTSPSAPSTISVSAHHFSLEDLAVSFITQTIETAKAQPASIKPSTLAPPVRPTPTNSRVKDELAAKQRRLEEHIAETKSLMTRISQSRSKEEKDILLKIMRQKTLIYEEETKIAASTSASSTPTPTPTPTSSSAPPRNTESSSVMGKSRSTATTQQTHITRWPVNQQDAGVLMISDDEDDDEGSDDDSEP